MKQWQGGEPKQLTASQINPEAHWQRTMPAESINRFVAESPVPVTLSVTPESAATVIEAYQGGRVEQLDDVCKFFNQCTIANHTLKNLRAFAKHTDFGDEMFFVVLIPSTEQDTLGYSVKALECQGIVVVDTGIALRKALYNHVDTPARENKPIAEEPADHASVIKEVDAIVAVIDFGIGFAHERFRDSNNKTRFEHFWAMNVDSGRSIGGDSTSVLVGTEWNKMQLDDAFQDADDTDQEIYSRLGVNCFEPDVHQPLLRRYTHGTHVLDVASGYDEDEREIADRRPIIGIQLPVEIVEDSSGAGSGPWLALALDWILCRAADLAARKGLKQHPPLVLNFSFGVNAGPMDGMGVIEQQIRHLIRDYNRIAGKYRCTVVLPAGNGRHLRSHFQSPISKTVDIPWRVIPDDHTASFVQVWLPEVDSRSAPVSVSVVPPGESNGIGKSLLNTSTDLLWGDGVIGRVYHLSVPRGDESHRECIVIALRPSASKSGEQPVAPHGLWRIKVNNSNYPPQSIVHARVQRDGAPFMFKKSGGQSYFDHPRYTRFDLESGRLQEEEINEDCPVVRGGTLNSYATADEPLVVAGFRESDGKPAVYSGAGPVVSGRNGPDLAASSERSPSEHGVLGAGTFSGTTAAFGGTSVAAPAVVRRIIDYIGPFSKDPFTTYTAWDSVINEVTKLEQLPRRGMHKYYKVITEQSQHRLGAGRLVSTKKRRPKVDPSVTLYT